MTANQSQSLNAPNNSIDNFRKEKFKEQHILDPEFSQQPHVIIENNLEMIEYLQLQLRQILEILEEGLETDSSEEKDKTLENIRDKIIQSFSKIQST